MLQIQCPFCGSRDEADFSYGGESHVIRPSPNVTDAEWADYLYNRRNPKGVHNERWCHLSGCGQWFNMARDTVTHEVIAVYKMGESAPNISAQPANKQRRDA